MTTVIADVAAIISTVAAIGALLHYYVRKPMQEIEKRVAHIERLIGVDYR